MRKYGFDQVRSRETDHNYFLEERKSREKGRNLGKEDRVAGG